VASGLGAPPAVRLEAIALSDIRCFSHVEVAFAPFGATVLVGPNGAGKTTVLEAVAYLGTQRSFRRVPREALVRRGAASGVVRARLSAPDGRPLLVEAEIAVQGRSRVQINRQVARNRRAGAAVVPSTVFSPDDLALVQGGPANRRELLDDALGALDPRLGALLDELDRILRQRNALLRQGKSRPSPEVERSLDVWDDRMGTAGAELVAERRHLLEALEPVVSSALGRLAAGSATCLRLRYVPSWEGDLAGALERARPEDLRRGVTTVGPHRDEVEIGLNGREARTQASQGEQRSLALALRLGVHHVMTARSGAPLLLLDDVFSELDPARSAALVGQLPPGQALITTATPLPAAITVGATLDVARLADTGRSDAGRSW
jgi:DNA replication and repair protein RecF